MIPKVKILVGNIGSGKSTVSKKYIEKGYVVISRDTLRYGIGNGAYTFNPNYEPIIKATEEFMLLEFLKLGVDIVVDECNVSKDSRKRIIDIVNKFDYDITIIKLKRLDSKESISRRLSDNHGDGDGLLWFDVWSRFDSMYEEPTLDEGVNSIITIGE